MKTNIARERSGESNELLARRIDGQGKSHPLVSHFKLLNLPTIEARKVRDCFFDKVFRSRCASRESQAFQSLYPLRLNGVRVFDQVSAGTDSLGDLLKAQRVRTVRRPEN